MANMLDDLAFREGRERIAVVLARDGLSVTCYGDVETALS